MTKQGQLIEQFPDAVEKARKANLTTVRSIEKRAGKPNAVLGPGLRLFNSFFAGRTYHPPELLDNLTRWLLEARDETEALIRANMQARWATEPDRIPGSVANSLKRSAGTNYQALVSFALAKFLYETGSSWYLRAPVPPEFRESLAVTFTAGIQEEPSEDASASASEDADTGGEGGDGTESTSVARVQPDVDILLRNAAWAPAAGVAEPVVLLSVKTSLADRGGQAARWKIYFDLATQPCPYLEQAGCAYQKLGISMGNASLYNITHGIVTANIYKYRFHDARYHAGELNSGQTRSNTYMFRLKLTTRNDGRARTPSDWNQFPFIVEVLNSLSDQYGLLR
jgi:hypothetical protein